MIRCKWFHTNTLRVRSLGLGVVRCNNGAWYHVRIARLSIAVIPARAS